jgi:hypothetical protein
MLSYFRALPDTFNQVVVSATFDYLGSYKWQETPSDLRYLV